MVAPEQHNHLMRSKLSALAGCVADWKEALDAVDPACTCTLNERRGFHSIDNAGCTSRRRCKAMTVLTVRTHMGMVQINTRHLSAAHIPRMVDDLAALFDELPATSQWLPFAQRLQQIVNTGFDPDRDTPTRSATAPTAAPDPSHTQPKEQNPS